MERSFEQLNELDVESLELAELREYWAQAWKTKPHPHISRKMLTRSLQFKIRQARGMGLSYDQQTKLDQLVRAYKRSRAEGSKRQFSIKSGTRFIREYAFVKEGENNRSPIMAIVSCTTSVAEYTGELLQISRLINCYKNSDNRLKRLLKKSKESSENGE